MPLRPRVGRDGSREILDRAAQDELLLLRNDLMTVYREVTPGDRRMFPLRYVRHSPRHAIPGNPPVLYLPDGPATASVLPFYQLRRSLAHADLDVIMVEHRGVGLSRLDDHGRDLPARAMDLPLVLEDIEAVLDRGQVEQAVVMGTGYGAQLAQLFAARCPERVHSLVLDSPRSSAADGVASQAELRHLYWHGTDPRTGPIAATIRGLVERGRLQDRHAGPVLQTIHEHGGVDAVRRIVGLLADDAGALTWSAIRQLLVQNLLTSTPYLVEHDLVAPIAHTQLGLSAAADGKPLDAASLLAVQGRGTAPYTGEVCDAVAASRRITAPTLILIGARDTITPPPTARAVAERIPGARLVEIADAGHGVLSSSVQLAIIAARWSVAGQQAELAAKAEELSALPRTAALRSLRQALRLALQAEEMSPRMLHLQRRLMASQRPDPRSHRARRARL